MKYYSNTPSKLNMKLKQYANNHSFVHDYQIKKIYNNMQSSVLLIEKQFSFLKYRTNKLTHYPVYNFYYQPLSSFMINNSNIHFGKCKSCKYLKKQLEEKDSKIKELTNLLNQKQSNVVNNICIQNVHNTSKNKYINNKPLSNEIKLEPNKNIKNPRYESIDINDSNNDNDNLPISLEDMQKITKKKSNI